MLRNRLWTLTSVALVAATTLFASTAKADATLAIGMKWEPVNYTAPVGLTGGQANASGTPLGSEKLYGWQVTSLNNYLGGFFGKGGQFGFHIGIDFGYGRVNHQITDSSGDVTVNQLSFLQFGFLLGGKFYILQPRRDRVVPYFYVDFFKYFASVNTSEEVDNDDVGYVAGLASPVGISLAVGAEYFFSPAFSLGGEIFGFRLAHSQGTNYNGDTDVEIITKKTMFSMYTAFTLNYRFMITGSVKMREVEGQEELGTPRRPPPPDRRPERRPPQDAPPSAESVD